MEFGSTVVVMHTQLAVWEVAGRTVFDSNFEKEIS